MYNDSWYNSLIKPALTPPPQVFPAAWTILYIMIALSLVFYVKDGINRRKIFPSIIFGVQLVLNFAWSPVFFMLHNPKSALVIVLMMIFFVMLTIKLFYQTSKTAAWLLIPYLIWIIFAAYLNLQIVRLN